MNRMRRAMILAGLPPAGTGTWVYAEDDMPLLRAAEQVVLAEEACESIPRWLPQWLYRRMLGNVMRRWNAANLALFDAQVAAMGESATAGCWMCRLNLPHRVPEQC